MFKGWIVLVFILLSGIGFTRHAKATGAVKTAVEQARTMVIQVKKSIPLSREEVVHKDYYLNVGSGQGVQPGWIYPVYRRSAVHDPFFNKSHGDLLIHVADLRILHVDAQVSVARLHGLTESAARPLLDEPTVMVGDAFDVSQGRRPAAAHVGHQGKAAGVSAAKTPSTLMGLSPEKAMEVLEAYQKAQASQPQQSSPVTDSAGSLFEEEDSAQTAPSVELPQTL